MIDAHQTEVPGVASAAQSVLTLGGLSLYLRENRLVGPRGELRLTAGHFKILRRLMEAPGAIIDYTDLIAELRPHGPEKEDDTGCLRAVILMLRRALQLLGVDKAVVLFVEPGCGYGSRSMPATTSAWRSSFAVSVN